MKKFIKKPKWNVGDEVQGRIIVTVFAYPDYAGRPSFRYGYRFRGEPENINLIYCMEATIVKKFYR